MGLDAKNERLCLNMQADTKNKDKYLAELLVGNAREFQNWVYEAVAEALEKNAKIIPDELMGEALSGFRRAAEIYRPETHADFTEYAQAWVNARVRAYIRKAERGDLPKTMLSSVVEYRRIMNMIKMDPAAGRNLGLEELKKFVCAAIELAAPSGEVAAVGFGV